MKTITQKLSQNAPKLITYWRVIAAFLLITVALIPYLQQPIIISVLLCAAVASISLNGRLARKRKMYSGRLRRIDSNTDIFLWIAALLPVSVIFPEFVKAHFLQIAILLASEIGIQLFGLFRFDKANALHTYAAKAWAILLALTVINLCAGNDGHIVFNVAFIWGCISQLETLFILARLSAARADVKSVFHI